VANIDFANRNIASHFNDIQFDISWDNSWRISAGAANWDAVWVFAKYRIDGGTSCANGPTWKHCTLSTTATDHSVTTNNGVGATITPSSDGKGVFMYRSGNGNGSINWQQVLLQWNYGTDGLADNCLVTVNIYAIEMVYIPTGNFYLGDGATAGIDGQLTAGTASTASYQITSEASVTLGGAGGNIGNNNATGQSSADDFNTATQKTLPAAWPKGYSQFYIMKNECSNEQYSEFLNTLTPTQQASRFPATTTANPFNKAGVAGNTPSLRNGVKLITAAVATTPAVFACDLNNNGTTNENTNPGDGMYIAYAGGSVPDMLAYLDWSGLRPMTEFEYEKACRGPVYPIPGEYAWGTTGIYAGSYLSAGNPLNPGQDIEVANSPSAALGNCTYSTTLGGSGAFGPLRCGIHGTATTTRVTSGQTYFGVNDMSGNLFEMVLSCGCVAGRSYTANHGNGALNANGDADVDFWPGINGNTLNTSTNNAYAGATGCTQSAGMGLKGGSHNAATWLDVSNRTWISWNPGNSRDGANNCRIGIRGTRTAP